MVGENDLSEYEKLRLINILRNNSFLASLGLSRSASVTSSAPSFVSTDIISANKQIKAEQREKKRSNDISKLAIQPTRYSKRIRLEMEDMGEELGEDDDDGIDYSKMPIESTALDDHEFQIFVILRNWRLFKSRELKIEPYKIFQNRTLAEIIRRRRQDLSWANATSGSSTIVSDIPSDTDIKLESFDSSVAMKTQFDADRNVEVKPQVTELTSCDVDSGDSIKVSKDLLQCWGIGTSKCKPGSFAFEILDILRGEDCIELFAQSRALTTTSEVATDGRQEH